MSFRKEFSHLGEIRSLLPEDVHLMALTATATKATRQHIVRILNMQKFTVVSASPMKTNLIYYVAKKKDLFHDLEPIIESLISKQNKMNRVIIFCRRYDEVTALYHYFQRRLGDTFTFPKGAPNLVQYRTIDMYTHCNHDSVKEEVVKLFTQDSHLQVVIGTIAFGMGIDCPDVREVIHWGVSDDTEMYVQESGGGGRDGGLSRCFMFYGGRDLDK